MFIFPWQWHVVIAFKKILELLMVNAARKVYKKRYKN
jgi:hypothetical protein